MKSLEEHQNQIQDQFTRQADPFAKRHGGTPDLELLDLIVQTSGVTSVDRVLDIACGPGLVSCAFARSAGQVTGLDCVPAMLERAKVRQREMGVKNVDWQAGQANALPFAEGSFDVVVARFSFHHYLHPSEALAEMERVCRPGGTILVADVAPASEAREAYDQMEIWRDPSHTQALTETEFEALGMGLNLRLERKKRYALESDLEGLLASSFPLPGNAEKIRTRIQEDIRSGEDSLGIDAYVRDGEVIFKFPVLILVWKKTDSPKK